jgi:glucokinase
VYLVGDIGGTNARLSLLSSTGRVLRHEVFESQKYTSLEAVAQIFLGKPVPRITAAAFGVAGAVVNGRVAATNFPWVIDARVFGRKMKIRRVHLLNDLVALGLGTLDVKPAKMKALGDAGLPKRKNANMAVLAAGTGLGEAILVWDEHRDAYIASPTEGGHADFAPIDDLSVELWHFLRTRYARVSYERILSGNGIGALYDFFRQAKGIEESAQNAEEIGNAHDRNAAISNLGLEGKSEAAVKALDLFVTIYGAEAGNLALKSLAVAGVYVCGNIAARLLPVLQRGAFRNAFNEKGRFSSLLSKVPVAVVLDTDVGLAGAARAAMQK